MWRPMSDAKYRMEHNHVVEQCYANFVSIIGMDFIQI